MPGPFGRSSGLQPGDPPVRPARSAPWLLAVLDTTRLVVTNPEVSSSPVSIVDPDELDRALAEAFAGSDAERRVVVRQAVDLADSGQVTEDRGEPLTVEEVVGNLKDAPDGSVASRWNWWLGALDVAYGGYEAFQVRRYSEE